MYEGIFNYGISFKGEGRREGSQFSKEESQKFVLKTYSEYIIHMILFLLVLFLRNYFSIYYISCFQFLSMF